VFSIAITLLVLEIRQPIKTAAAQHLFDQLNNLWFSFWGFVVSFLTILVMWINHHRIFRMVKRSDDILLLTNGFLLLVVTFVPYVTSVLADNLNPAQGTKLDREEAVMFYSGTFFVLAVAYNILWWSVSYHNRLIDRSTPRQNVVSLTRQYMVGPLLYGLATVVARFYPALGIATDMTLAMFFVIPSTLMARKPRGASTKKGPAP
jgi:uncharacterized membrane protein